MHLLEKEIKTMLFTWNLKMKRQVKENKNMGTFDKKREASKRLNEVKESLYNDGFSTKRNYSVRISIRFSK